MAARKLIGGGKLVDTRVEEPAVFRDTVPLFSHLRIVNLIILLLENFGMVEYLVGESFQASFHRACGICS